MQESNDGDSLPFWMYIYYIIYFWLRMMFAEFSLRIIIMGVYLARQSKKILKIDNDDLQNNQDSDKHRPEAG